MRIQPVINNNYTITKQDNNYNPSFGKLNISSDTPKEISQAIIKNEGIQYLTLSS